MNNIIRFWNQNRKGIIAGIIAIAFIIIILQVLNQIAKDNKKRELKNRASITQEEKELPTESIITGQEINLSTTKENVSIIKDFVEKCNNRDIDGAYDLITDNCKKLIFPTKQDFIDKYYEIIFKQKKSCDIQNFLNDSKTYTYDVKFFDNSLAMGTLSSNNYHDYITVDNSSDQRKLSISNYIKNESVNKIISKNDIVINVISRDIYQGYERYNIKIENKTNNTVLLNNIKIVTEENVQHNANMSEIATSLLKINPYMEREYSIRFNINYNPNIKDSKIKFEDMICNYVENESTQEKVNEKVNVEINI